MGSRLIVTIRQMGKVDGTLLLPMSLLLLNELEASHNTSAFSRKCWQKAFLLLSTRLTGYETDRGQNLEEAIGSIKYLFQVGDC